MIGPLPRVTEKRCLSCGETKPAADYGRNRSLKDGLSFYCLACNRERNNASCRRHRRSLGKEVRDHSRIPDGPRWCPSCRQPVAHEEYTRSSLPASASASGFGGRCKGCHDTAGSDYYFYRKHRLTKNHVADIRAAQNDRCADCGDREPQHLDHDHATGVTRQLLCQRCNHGLGLFRDNSDLLHSAAFHVDGHRSRQLLERLAETFVVHPGTDGLPGTPPVGSEGAPERPRGDRVTGRTSGSRRHRTAGEADT